MTGAGKTRFPFKLSEAEFRELMPSMAGAMRPRRTFFALEMSEAQVEARLAPLLKGAKGGNCNRTACQKPGAFFYNTAMRSYYCLECARAIDSCDKDMPLFPDLAKKFEATWGAGYQGQQPRPMRLEVIISNCYPDSDIQAILELGVGAEHAPHDAHHNDPEHRVRRVL